MSHLADHARALRVLAEVWRDEFVAQTDEHLTLMAGMLAHGFGTAADRLDAELRADSERMAASHRCTVDHSTLPRGVAKCGACGAPREAK